jgi:hypothetical protein
MHSQTHANGFHNKIILCGNLLKTIVSFILLPVTELLIIFKNCAALGWGCLAGKINNNVQTGRQSKDKREYTGNTAD